MNPRLLSIVLLLTLTVVLAACEDENSADNPTAPGSGNLPDITGYPIVSTNQSAFFDSRTEIGEPAAGDAYFGQDAHYSGLVPDYVDNGDGTVTDMNTGLMWQQDFGTVEFADAEAAAASASTGGYDDWRVPTIKELYSLIDFTGNQGSGNPSQTDPPADARPFIDTDFFNFEYPTSGRYIDVQIVSTSTYSGVALNNPNTVFGLNVADGRIKAYPQTGTGDDSAFESLFVRGNASYGLNDFDDNGDGTVTDRATGLMWSTVDSGDEIFADLLDEYTRSDGSLNWEEALDFAETVEYAGHDDWRLPDAKQLHSLLDYQRGPDATASAAIDPVFRCSEISNEADVADFPGYWTSTSFEPGSDVVVIYFGRAMGYVGGQFIDVHGAGCQRTDPKAGEPDYGFGPQGDVRRVYNYVRLVRVP